VEAERAVGEGKRPLVLVPAGRVDEEGPRAREGVAEALTRRLAQAGVVPLILPRLAPPLEDVLAVAHGVVLAGGGDVHPRHFGEEPRPGLGPVDPERDELELWLIRRALPGIPLLGICRGMQVLVVALGGRAVQDLGETRGGDRLLHRQTAPAAFGWHSVDLDPQSRLAVLLGRTRLFVNSFHHQAVAEPLPPGVVAVARAPDGVVEAVEVEGASFAVGVAWHPELLRDEDGASSLLFAAFADACRAFARGGKGG